MGKFDKQLKYSIRKVSVGAASVVIGAFYLAMGAGVVHAETNTTTDGGASHSSPSPDPEPSRPNGLTSSSYGAVPAQNPGGLQAGAVHSVKEETKTITRTIKYVDASDESKEVSATVTQTVTLTRKQGTEEWTTGKWEAQTSPTVNGFGAPDKSTIESKEVTSTTENEDVIVYYTKLDASSTSSTSTTRGRRSKRDVENPPAGGTSNTSTGTETPTGTSTGNNETLNSAVTERKGLQYKKDQPGINIPKGNEPGADDPNAHLSFNDPDHTVTVEEMWKIIQNMPDDFQNNERSYLRNMDTLGNALRFDKTETNPEGVPLQPGEIREISSFGGWTAIMKKDGTTGKFAVGMKNEQGYFTGWYNKNGERQEGGMLGSNALDQIYVHEQALDRRFKYMLMLAKGRTIANKDDIAQDGSPFKIVTPNSTENQANLASLPVKEKEDILQHAPNIEGFTGIEKTFTAFSTAYGSRLKIEFVTGYISDFEGSKGTYRIVVKAIKKDQTEETVYDHTINRIDGVVENEERYSQGVDLSGVNGVIKKLMRLEYDKKVDTLAGEKYKEKYPDERRPNRDKLAALKEEAKQELAKNGDAIVELPIDKDKLNEKNFKKETNFKESFGRYGNELNNVLKQMKNPEVQKNSPIWLATSEKYPDNPNLTKSKDPDRVYKLLDFILPTAKKIIYHADTDQLELQTDPEKVTRHRADLNTRLAAKKAELETANDEKKIELKKEISALESAIRSTNAYTYTEARNGSKEVKILGSHMEDKTKPDSTEISETEYGKYHTNELAEKESDGLSKFTRYFVEKENVTRTGVLPDDKLSEKITTAIEGDQDKLGKGGYFSTGDIPLGKDVVSYKIQVFAENEKKRVGVNMQSPRLQYNLPILADFSVIQDTVGPSKELARRIISKSNIPEDKKNKIIEEINKSKKTSEIKSQLSGDVKVKYQDVSGNVLTLDNTKEHQKETDLGKKEEDGTYLAVDSGIRYTDYNVADKKLENITTSDGKHYRLKRSLADGTLDDGRLRTSDAERGTISASPATVTFVYEEYTPPATGKGVVHFKKQVTDTTTEALTGYADITLSGNVGETFSSTEVDTKITELKKAGYEIVSNEFATNSKTIDSTTDEDGQEPSQVYNVIVREKVETVTTPPTPNTPVDPNVPEGPKWPAEGLKESDLKKEVTRTINYFKKETADGKKIADAQPTKVDKVLYKRTATYNLVSKTVTYSGWTATADDTHTATSFSPVKTPVLAGYVADFKEVTDAPAAPNENGEVTNMTREVVYTKLGSWVPKIPGKTPTPIPYPNDPKDPTKPKYPDYPTTPENPDGTPVNPGGSTPGGETPGTPGGGNETPGGETPGTPEKPKTPELPVIPYEPGYTPGIPTDPTQPEDPNTNPLVPLTPVDPKDPKKGYKVPKIPTKPGNDTPITYVADPQKALVKVVKVEGEGDKKTETPLTEYNVPIAGKTGDQIPTGTVTAKITELEKRGYIVDNKQDVLTAIAKDPFDKDKDTDGEDPTQTFTLKVHEKLVPVTPPTDDQPITPRTPIDPDAPVDPKNPNDPLIPTWTEDLIKKVKNAETTKEVTRTINYVDEAGNKVTYTANGNETTEPKTDKVTFTREAKINVVTKEITYGEWTAKDNDTTFDEVTSPVVKGYILKADQGSEDGLVTVGGTRVVASTNLTATSENQNLNVVYTKLGSWVLTPPTGVTPPEGTNFNPKPYPNHPTDPTRPGTPVYPEPGQPITPGTPVIPYVPGYTPKIGDKPLEPVDPNNPESGYKVPPVPTTPGNDTPITYEGNPQKALVKVVKVEGEGDKKTETPLPKDNVTINGKTGDQIPTESVTAKIADLEKRGYIVDNKQDVLTAIGENPFDKDKDTDGEDPTQTFTLKVHEKVVEVTEPPTPNTPVDPNVPEGPKWPESGLKESDLKKEVTRTITYVKKDTPNGEEIPDAKPTVTQTAHFKRSATYNAVTGTITYGNWESADKELAKVDTPALIGYVADKASIEKVETNADSTGLDQKVVYTKLGSWVPNLPEGVTPPTGTDMTPKPYPNNPTDPTKPGTPVYPEPGTPTDPNTPQPPVIPYVPGYTPKTPDGNPLVPVDPNHPENGYKVPPVPTTPGEDTPITYVADPQKAVVKVFNTTTGTEVELPAEKVSIDNGTTDSAIPTDSVTAKIADLEKRGYVVENKDLLKDQKFDNEKDPTDGDPTQVFRLLVKERTVTVTEPKNPNDPVDPDKPEGPKWPETGLKESDLKKEVTRTITYVKKETADGPEIADAKPTVTQTAHFKRSATYNAVTGAITYGNWESTDKELAKVDTPELTGYVADKASVDKVETNADSTGLDQKVVYTKLGSWVPNLPEGVKPPEGTDMTPKPYPNNPTDPTKPGTPVYPEPGQPITPGTPVIPYVPGYTPKIGETPLQPVDPNNPRNGYKVPPVPTTPGNDTPITYVADPQKAVVKVFNTTTGTEVELPAEKVSIDNGTTDSAIPTDSVTAKIADLEKRGYVVENKDLLKDQKFDNEKDPTDGDPTQVFRLLVKERTVTVTEPKNPNDPVDPDKPEGPKWPETGLKESDLKKEVTRTITYVKKETADGPEIADAKPTVTQTAHFKRSATYNAVTGAITYGNWESTDKELAKVDTPELTGYVADKASVDKVETNADSTGLDQKVVYTKLGSWVPNLPEGVKPPEGTDMTPKPYPNNPTDPTKPGTPVYPEPGQPITPGTPVIPYVPGYTPKIGETPLQPVDPNNPRNGYKVPPVPTTPGNDTPITYVADPQKAVVKVFNTTTGTEVELPAEKVSIDNGTTDSAIPTDSVTAKIADLEKRGYVVENKDLLNNQKFDNEKDPTDGDPTQVFRLLVKERTVTVTEPKNPNDPVDPDKPEGPKWPETGLKESDLKKEVTRTITYVKKETADGPEIADAKPTVTQTAHFKRSATYNAVTGAITYGNWESADKELAKVDTPELTGYVADKASVDKVETNADSTGLDQKVVYTKLGSWVPTPPAGVTPPTGTNFDPKPYPNNPTDPTKPGTPVYPEPGQPITPGTPVIPYVPGYTPKTPDGNPLVPVDPNHPESGYKVPPVPTTPGNDTPIEYSKDPQKAVVKVFNTTTGTEVELPAEKVELSGKTGEPIPTDSVTAKIAELEKRGYTVENKEPLKGETFDKNKDPENGDPTQVFKLLVKERTVTVTEPPTPDTPVDPNVPEGPKWPETGLKESELKKEVTRTITYVKKETANGPEIADAKPTVTQTAHFKRSATYNAVTGTITYGNWESADKELAKVDTPALTGYVADKASVDKVETNADSTGLDQKVVYTKLGSWVPTPPAGVTPPTGTNFDPKPYPNNPTDPTKPGTPVYPEPGTPTDPNTPQPPVIPYVPGYTPKTPDGNPLVPVDPNHPENGYKVPPVPTTPGNDTPITYEGNPQKVLVKVVKVDGTTETPLPKDNVTINGKTGDQIPTESVTAKIAELEKRGYVIDNRDEVVNYINNKFDKEKDTEGQDPTQNTTLKVHEKLVPVTPPTPEKPLEPGQPIDPDTPVDPNNPNDPTIPRWTDELIKKLDVKKEVTRTINYVDEAGNKVSEPSTDKVTFTREAKINVVTGEITYGDWKAVGGDTTFDKVSSPVVKGYILKDPAQKEVAERKGITPTVANQTIEVVYKKLGSWVPKVPGVETPTPLPYPNDPTDPTKPGDPTDPNRPNVPVIPYVPGYTPKTPDGNPLVPVDPNHPENGYKVPPVPTEPGKDTPIEYVKVPNTPSPEEPVKPTPESSHITIWVDENGKPLKPEKPGTHEPGNIPGYRFITTTTKDGVTIHKFEKITPVEPNNPVPQKPTTPIPTPQDPTIPTPESQIPTPNTPEANTPTSETSRREELPNTGTEANATLAGAGIMTLLAGLGLGFFKKKEEDESE